MISELFAKYKFGAIHTFDITDCKVMNSAMLSGESEIFYHSYLPKCILTADDEFHVDV